jgi:prepilin-type N-terminal cleavage/methylation domain-containing protein
MWRLRNAFTLIELLVVVVIIGLLMSMTVPVVYAILKRGKINQANTEAREILQALIAYHHEYRKFPFGDNNWYQPSSKQDRDGGDIGPRTDAFIYDILTARNSAVAHNPRKIPFLRTALDAGGGEKYRDPWGNPYQLSFDSNFNGTLLMWWWNVANNRWEEDRYVNGKLIGVRSLGPNGVWDRLGQGDDIAAYE